MLLLLPTILKAQSANIDSLINMLNTTELFVENRLSLYEQISDSYSRIEPEKGILYGKEGLTLAEKERNKSMIARLCITIGNSYTTKSSYDSSMIYLNKAMDISKETGDRKTEAAATAETGLGYASQHKYEEAIEYYLKSLPLYESVGDKANYTRILINISGIHGSLNQNERSLYYLKQAQIHVKEVNHPILKIAVYELLGSYYLRTEKDFEKALENMLIAYEQSREHNIPTYIITTAQFLAGIYTDGFKDYKKAEKYALECIETAEAISSKDYTIMAGNILTKVYLATGKYKEGKEIALKAWQADSTTIQTATNTAYSLAVCYLSTGEREKALYYFDKHNKFRMKQYEERFYDSVSDMEVKYETEKKEMRISALEKEQKLHVGLGVALAVALLSVIGLLIYRHRLVAQKKKIAEQQVIRLEQEKELIAVQSSLKAEKTERDLIAHDLHDSVSSLLTVAKNNMNLYSASEYKKTDYFNNAFEVLSKSITELRRVVYHLKSFILTKEGLAAALDDFCRFIPNAEFHFKGLNRRFDPDKEYILYDSACELINNALKHSGASHIDVHLNMDEQTVYLSVADNGAGFDSREIQPGIGLDNIRSNLSAFGGHLDILSEPDKGTEANIELEI